MSEALYKFFNDQPFFRHLIEYLAPNHSSDPDVEENGAFQHPVRLLMVLSLAVFSGLIIVYALQTFSERERPGKYFDPHRDYLRMPFDINDATGICTHKTELRFGEQLVRSHVDNHSTRYDPKLGIYKVFMSAQLGDLYIYEEAPVHCFVNPREHMISHYRTFEKRQSLMTRALKVISFKK
ncbi:hypothetical protein P886_1441 [Alteromonadaceae bacterium 2753L.S.0a.02]|nr:hypothetical protein P886_1441 [Alteromonadaceae bacterium 2753L.S.0a.02]